MDIDKKVTKYLKFLVLTLYAYLVAPKTYGKRGKYPRNCLNGGWVGG
jgi:hypothetical protein